jgi:hypothetical protein
MFAVPLTNTDSLYIKAHRLQRSRSMLHCQCPYNKGGTAATESACHVAWLASLQQKATVTKYLSNITDYQRDQKQTKNVFKMCAAQTFYLVI